MDDVYWYEEEWEPVEPVCYTTLQDEDITKVTYSLYYINTYFIINRCLKAFKEYVLLSHYQHEMRSKTIDFRRYVYISITCDYICTIGVYY